MMILSKANGEHTQNYRKMKFMMKGKLIFKYIFKKKGKLTAPLCLILPLIYVLVVQISAIYFCYSFHYVWEANDFFFVKFTYQFIFYFFIQKWNAHSFEFYDFSSKHFRHIKSTIILRFFTSSPFILIDHGYMTKVFFFQRRILIFDNFKWRWYTVKCTRKSVCLIIVLPSLCDVGVCVILK